MSSNSSKRDVSEFISTTPPTQKEEVAASEAAPTKAVAETPAPTEVTPKEETPLAAPTPATQPVVVKETVAANVAPATVKETNPRVKFFREACGRYIAKSKGIISTEVATTERLVDLISIIRHVYNSMDTAVFDEAYKFFKENRNGILAEDVVFQYIHKIPTETSIRLQTIYTVMRELVDANREKRAFRLDLGLIRDSMKLPSESPLLNWIGTKVKMN